MFQCHHHILIYDNEDSLREEQNSSRQFFLYNCSTQQGQQIDIAYPANNHPRFSEIDSILIGLRLESSPHTHQCNTARTSVLYIYIRLRPRGIGAMQWDEGGVFTTEAGNLLLLKQSALFLRCSMVHFLSFKAISIVILTFFLLPSFF